MERMVFHSEHDFLHKLEELVKSGVKPGDIETRAPHPVHHAEEILEMKPSNVRLFALVGRAGGRRDRLPLSRRSRRSTGRCRSATSRSSAFRPSPIIAFELMVLFGGALRVPGIPDRRRACRVCAPSCPTTSLHGQFRDPREEGCPLVKVPATNLAGIVVGSVVVVVVAALAERLLDGPGGSLLLTMAFWLGVAEGATVLMAAAEMARGTGTTTSRQRCCPPTRSSP